MKIKNVMLLLALIYSHCSYSTATDSISSDKNILDPVEHIFTTIYKTNRWGSQESISGPGSELKVTQRMIQKLALLIRLFDINSLADAPCGDLNWMKHVNLGTCTYIGIDIVKELIENNKKLFGSSKEFKHFNLIEGIIDTVDLIICRDMLAHLTNEQVFTVLKNFKKSGSKYILMTINLSATENHDISPGDWRGINFERPPFNFTKPLLLIEEDVPFTWERGKYLGLWRLEDINI